MDLSARLAAATSLLLAIVCIIEVAAQNGLCPPEPVVVYLSRGQKVTVRYWVGEEAQQEVTEVPKLTRRPPRPETTTLSDEELHGRLGEHNVTQALPSEDENTSTITSAQTTVEEADTTTAEKAHTDVTKEIQYEADEPQSDVTKEHDQPSRSTESDITAAAVTTQIAAEEHTVASSVTASTVSDSSSDLETTVTTVVASSSTTGLKHEVEYAADAESADAAHAEQQTTASLPAEGTTVAEVTSAPTTSASSASSSVEENATQSLLYRSPNNESDSIPLTLESDDNPDNVTEVSTTPAAENAVVTEDHLSTTNSEPTDGASTSSSSSVTTQSSPSSESTSKSVELADEGERTESHEITNSEITATSEDATTRTTTEDATTPTTTEDATTPATTEDATTPTPTATEDITTQTIAESNVSDEATNSPTTHSYREGEITVIVEEEANNETTSDKPLISVINDTNAKTEFSLEQSFSVGNVNNSERDDSVDVYAQDDVPATDATQSSSTTGFSETIQTSSNEQSTTSASVEISTEAILETNSESSDTATSATDLLPKIHVETTSENAATSEVASSTVHSISSEPATTSEALSSRIDGISTTIVTDATTASGSDDTSEDSESTMPPLVAGDESLFESILHQVLVANATEAEEEAKEGRKLDKDNDVYPGNDNPERITEDEPEAEEVRVATEEYLSTLAEEAEVPEDKEDSTSTEKSVPEEEDKEHDGDDIDLRVDEHIPAGPRRGPDPNPDWDTPVSHYAYPESSGPHGPRVYIGSRSRREVTFASANTTLCQWIFKTDPGVPLLLTFKNFSTPDSERCVHHHIAVERSNGYEARWCGGAYESPSHATFARHEIKLRLYSEHDGGAPSGFVAEIQALDMKLLRKAVPKARPLLHHPHH